MAGNESTGDQHTGDRHTGDRHTGRERIGGAPGSRVPEAGESIADVIASIRAVVSAETEARAAGGGETVLMLTPEMRRDAGAGLAEGLGDERPGDQLGDRDPAPILDEESLRGLINRIVREELQGELGDRIARNLRKTIRREIIQILDERRDGEPKP